MTQKTPPPVQREKCVFSCTDRLCRTLDQIGVPEDEKWRSLILYMRSLGSHERLSAEQKSEIQGEVLAILKARDFSGGRYRAAVARIDEIVSAPYRQRLEAALNEAASAATEFERLIRARKSDVQNLENCTVDAVLREKEPEVIVSRLKQLFSDVLEAMDRDAEMFIAMSRTDALTGLSNRRGLDASLTAAVKEASAAGRPLSMLMIDIDHFKVFNDRYGHLVGDQALATLARILTEQAVKSRAGASGDCLPARFGGEEFCLILPGRTLAEARDFAENVRGMVEGFDFVIRGSDDRVIESGIKMTVSVGVAELRDEWRDAPSESLINAADMALYQAKYQGRNKVCVYAD